MPEPTQETLVQPVQSIDTRTFKQRKPFGKRTPLRAPSSTYTELFDLHGVCFFLCSFTSRRGVRYTKQVPEQGTGHCWALCEGEESVAIGQDQVFGATRAYYVTIRNDYQVRFCFCSSLRDKWVWKWEWQVANGYQCLSGLLPLII